MVSLYKPLHEWPYVGVHARHGDKAVECVKMKGQSCMISLPEIMHEVETFWPDHRAVFVSTDDADVLTAKSLASLEARNYSFRFTPHEHRYSGGEPNSHNAKHSYDNDAV